METEKKVNQQQVLFRFTSLRAPELANQDTQVYNFVFHPDGIGRFAEAVENRPEGQSVSEAMREAAAAYRDDAYSAQKFRDTFEDTLSVAEWISRNKYSFSAEDVLKKIEGISGLPEVGLLWDNLFFQIIEQTDYYAKDIVIEFLVLRHLIDVHNKTTDPAKFLPLLPDLMTATVVLPLDLFPDEPQEETAKAAGAKPIFGTKDLTMSLNVLLAQSGIESHQTAISEVKKMQTAYRRDYDKKYQAATKVYDVALAAAFEAATVVEKTRTECPSGCVITYYEYENLVMPAFDFVPPKNVDQPWLKSILTAESYYVVESLDLQDEPTYDSIINGVNASIAKLNFQLYSNQPSGQNIVGIGSMMFKVDAGAAGNTFLSNDEIPFVAYFEYTTYAPIKGKIQLSLNLGYQNGDAVSAIYTATLPDGTETTAENFFDTPNGTMLNMTLFPSPSLPVATGNETIDLTAAIGLSDGSVIELECTVPVKERQQVSGVGKVISGNSADNGTPFIPPKFGIRRLGIGEYKKVVAEVCCYREAEVSNIVNIMQGEFLSRTTTRERIEETTTTVESSTEKENLTDTTTSERFEMQTEIAKILQQDKQISAYADVKAHGERWSLDAGGTYATNNSKEESNRQAVTQATEITQRAMERIVTKFRQEVVTKITESFKEENSHIYDNRGGEGHISGVYRFINAIYKNQIYNYGKRLMYEFMVPEPSRIYRAGMKIDGSNTTPTNSTIQLVMPADPVSLGLLSALDINDGNYRAFAARYRAEVEAPIAAQTITGKSYQGKGSEGSFSMEYEFKLPAGYQINRVEYSYSVRKSNPNLNAQLIIGSNVVNIQKTGSSVNGYPTYLPIPGAPGPQGFPGVIDYTVTAMTPYNLDNIPVSFTGWDVGSYSFTLTAVMDRTDAVFSEWQIKTYDAIIKAYRERLDEFNEQVNSAQEDAGKMLASNPLFYREIERITLKRNCISYIQPENYFGQNFYAGNDFTSFHVSQTQPMDDYASHAKFMEQAFEWDIMSYNFYPYYWGSTGKWQELYQTENDDPTFRSFMQSGMARVVVSVRPGFEKAVMHYMKFGVIWDGGEMPVIGDPLYLAIVDELKEPEYTVDETWETVVPTSLIGIQKQGVLIEEDGLPCGGGCEDGDNPLKPNPNVLPNPLEKAPS